jgi:hypothetical protein
MTIENKETFHARIQPYFSPSIQLDVKLAYTLAKFGHRAQTRKEVDNDGNKISETEKWVDVGYRNRGDFPQMLSNLFPYNFKFRGKKLNSIENFFQGIKFKNKK